MYLERPTYALKRAFGIPAWRHASGRSLLDTLTSAQKMKRGQQRFSRLSEEEKKVVFDQALRKGWMLGTQGAPPGNAHAVKHPDVATTLLSCGFLLAWNQPEFHSKSLHMLLKQVKAAEPGSAKYEKLMERIRQDPMLIREWAVCFPVFLQEQLPHAGIITEISACMALSLKADGAALALTHHGLQQAPGSG